METYIDNFQRNCPVRATLDLITGRWKPLILQEIKDGRKRYVDIQSKIPQISAQALTLQLRQLEADGLIAKQNTENTSIFFYQMTELGIGLSDVMEQLDIFGKKYLVHRALREKELKNL